MTCCIMALMTQQQNTERMLSGIKVTSLEIVTVLPPLTVLPSYFHFIWNKGGKTVTVSRPVRRRRKFWGFGTWILRFALKNQRF